MIRGVAVLLTNLISLYLLSVTVTVVFCAVYIRTLNGANYTKMAILLCLAVCFYILGYTMELNAFTTSQILFWNRIEYIGIPFVSALWLTISLMYTGHFVSHKKLLIAAIYIVPVLTLIFRLTNRFHHLYFASIAFVQEFGILFLKKQPGPWLYVQMGHSISMILISMGFLISDSVKRPKKKIGEILFVIAASVFAVGGLILSQLKPFKLQIDYMAMCLPVTCIMVIMAISQYDLLETKCIARSKVFYVSSDPILLINCQNRVIDYNNSAKKLFEKLDIRLAERDITNLFGKIADLPESLKKTESSVVKFNINGEEHYYDIATESIGSSKVPRGWIKVIRDVTEIYQLNEELNKLAMTDELSILSNRRAFMNAGRDWIAASTGDSVTLHLLMMDLDYFKNVNDQYGHLAGDMVIREFARILKNHFDSNCLIARLGGEEFAVLAEGYHEEEMRKQANALLVKINQHVYKHFEFQFHVTVSIGMTNWQYGQTLEDIMRKADRALYQSKAKGRNCMTML